MERPSKQILEHLILVFSSFVRMGSKDTTLFSKTRLTSWKKRFLLVMFIPMITKKEYGT
jgi:hypothetical protein